jgi:hypothetical protein
MAADCGSQNTQLFRVRVEYEIHDGVASQLETTEELIAMVRSLVLNEALAMPKPAALEYLTDDDGSVLLGWLASDVLYVRFAGRLSAAIGEAYVARLQTSLTNVQSVSYFSDASALQSYDLLARSAFVRFVLANRRVLTSMVMLTWSTGVGPVAANIAATLGDDFEVLTDPKEFATRLLQVAPFARRQLDPKTWQRKPMATVAR